MASHGVTLLRYLLLLLFTYRTFADGLKHECDRDCVEDEAPKRCYFHFTLRVGFRANKKPILSVNGNTPGPGISVCRNDFLVVDVKNELPFGLETSIHWHGIEQNGTPEMDGVPMVTQCPIQPHTTFRYQFKTTRSGSYYYHAHSSSQQLDGLFGALIVHEQNEEYNEETIIFSPELAHSASLRDDIEANLTVVGLLMSTNLKVSRNKSKSGEKLRLINAAALDCPLSISTNLLTQFQLVAVDGSEIEPMSLDHFVLYPGERNEIIINAEDVTKLRIVGYHLCSGHAESLITSQPDGKCQSEKDNSSLDPSSFLLSLKPKNKVKVKKSEAQFFVSFDNAIPSSFIEDVDFRYKIGELTSYTPSFLSKNQLKVPQINEKSFLLPPSPMLSQPEEVPHDIMCSLDYPAARCGLTSSGFCECLQVLDLPYNRMVDLFLIDEGKHGNTSHTFHVHGHSFLVLATASFDHPIEATDIETKDYHGEIKKNLVNAVSKDSIVVPNKGFAVLRLRTNNPGYWLVESVTSKAELEAGLQMILHVEDPNGKKSIPEKFPTCGTLKEPDLVFG